MRRKYISAAAWFLILFVLILDGKSALTGAAEGIDICLRTVIPALFPFFVITGMLTSTLAGMRIPGMNWLCRICKIPTNFESIFLLGILGGYPMGARAIGECYRHGYIDKHNAERMLGFCCNCGPSFIFGICASFFPGLIYGWIQWGIQIITAIIMGMILPGNHSSKIAISGKNAITLERALKDSIQAMARVCGWVVLFRVFLTLQSRWVLWLLPKSLQPLIIGLQELSNGCIGLNAIQDIAARFVICSCMLTFGGLCVIMQTRTVTDGLGLGWYFPGKCIQTGMGILVSLIIMKWFFKFSISVLPYLLGAIICISVGVLDLIRKNSSIFAKCVV